ncbi:TPA: hypothetical protein N0F65_008649 [Lagenidium giganteum]|uniref:mitogen-activated protein kinase kinase n=1 Tax=Lagenidium giganteum TaxID=4803 RepID=A0AAV2ZCV4_9STRA|nr:TPA: hypothetical protein N0F65_008649 [Lagenidium giganteum]
MVVSKLKKPDSFSRGMTGKDEKRSAVHTSEDDTPAESKLPRPSSGVGQLKESKLKQPEALPKFLDKSRTQSSDKALAGTDGRGAPAKVTERSGVAPPRADPKHEDTSLHTARSVQSLANEIRRIRSLRTENADGKETEEETKKRERKPSNLRSKIKLEITDSLLDQSIDLDEKPQQTSSPKISTAQPTVSPNAGSTGKRGLHRNFAPGLNFQLDLQHDERVDKSYDLSASGTFDALGFQIKQSGITRSPDRASSQPSHTKKHLVKMGILGRGASGVVHKALHVPSLLLVAVKVIPVFENDKRHQLIAELKALYNNLSTLSDDVTERKTVACPEIVCLYDAFMNHNEGNVSIVVEYMDGGSLQDIVDTGGCKSENVLANISYRVLKGLAFLHNTHQLHRDIKPSNLLINHFGDVKISDFGIVREMENSMAKATTFVGTLTYMSPERIASEEYSYKSDVWSMGLSIMTCALGKFPYSSRGGYWELLHMIRNEPPPRLPKGEFSDVFSDFLDKCLKKDQAERWSVKQLLQHDFVKHCAEQRNGPQSMSPGAPVDDDSSDWSHSNHDDDEESKAEVEVDEIVRKVTDYYMKNAKELIHDHRYSLQDIVAWIQLLPAMQKMKLARFADQIGANRRRVYEKFHDGMNDLLQDIQDTYFSKDTK